MDVHRIIPAGAGNSDAKEAKDGGSSDHPRRRGELLTREDTSMRQLGSSPQARGTQGTVQGRVPEHWIIPAGAGNSLHPRARFVYRADHPRRRGELYRDFIHNTCGCGSSPQARGTRCAGSCGPCPRRIIPAGAGNSPAGFPGLQGSSDHPRRRGELHPDGDIRGRLSGSSPQARGTRSGSCG